jgi:hypothetical protein
MVNKNNQLRNPFVALCDYASRGNWCWNIECTTCGHGAFRVTFSKIARDQHPDDESFWPYGKENHEPIKEMNVYGDFFRGASISRQIKLASIVAEAKLSDIQAVAKFPDWLGYIGLVMEHCYCEETQKTISNAFLPQFIDLVKNDKELHDYFQEKQSSQQFLSIGDLSRIESSMLTHRKS